MAAKTAAFKLGYVVEKVRGSEWVGTVCGTYSTDLTPEGYCVESLAHAGSVQIYPATALKLLIQENDMSDWTKWYGETEHLPVGPGVEVEVMLRDGVTLSGEAGAFKWRTIDDSFDIVAYRVVKDLDIPVPTVEHHDSVDDMLAQRGKRYGEFTGHSQITQDLKTVMRAAPQWVATTDDQKECLEMIAHKIGRILNGDPHYYDSWKDIAGYAKLVSDRLENGASK